jgi:hypothetical protein
MHDDLHSPPSPRAQRSFTARPSARDVGRENGTTVIGSSGAQGFDPGSSAHFFCPLGVAAHPQ